ncbi:MAG: hypothetical protein JWO51_812 [Rhodospirillales bacterium]|nr:hypothetical protein [Rhodospirillales bacterium]
MAEAPPSHEPGYLRIRPAPDRKGTGGPELFNQTFVGNIVPHQKNYRRKSAINLRVFRKFDRNHLPIGQFLFNSRNNRRCSAEWKGSVKWQTIAGETIIDVGVVSFLPSVIWSAAPDYDRERRYGADYPGVRTPDDYNRYRRTEYLRGAMAMTAMAPAMRGLWDRPSARRPEPPRAPPDHSEERENVGLALARGRDGAIVSNGTGKRTKRRK